MKNKITQFFVASLLFALLLNCNDQRPMSLSQSNRLISLIEGSWIGTLDVQNADFQFALTFDNNEGYFRGKMDIISSLSPNIEVANIRLEDELVSFELPILQNESLRFEGLVSEKTFRGEAVYSGDTGIRGNFSLKAVGFETLPTWVRGGETWNWHENQRQNWPTKEWTIVSSSSAELDTQALSAASEVIRERFPGVHALLITRGEHLAYEEYFHGGSVSEPINIKSVSKGIITALVGIAIREGNITSMDQSVASFLPKYFEETDDQKKMEIRLHHLLDMTSGLEWIENGSPTIEWARRGHSTAYYLSLPLECEPGECFNYSTASTHMLSEIIALKAGTTTRAFAERYLFNPIGVKIIDWWQSRSGVHIGGADILMTARDMAKIGLLMSSHGMWDSLEVIPKEWINECISYQSDGQPFVGSYGYGWWRRTIKGHPAFIGKGYGGQFIVVVPDSDLVVVVGSDISSPEMAPIIEHWICESVVPTAFQK